MLLLKRFLYLCFSFLVGYYSMISTINSFEKAKPKKDSVLSVIQSEKPTKKDYTKMKVIATAYCPCQRCSEGYGRQTSTGAIATAGRTIAVDPSVIPYGSKVIINGKTYIAEDCGGAIKGCRIDVFFNTHAEVEKFGKRELTVFVSKSS